MMKNTTRSSYLTLLDLEEVYDRILSLEHSLRGFCNV